MSKKKISFKLGQLHMTSRVAYNLGTSSNFNRFVFKSILRHGKEDWGDCSQEDITANNYSVNEGSRIISVYNFPSHIKIENENRIWIITEGDRSYSTVLFPSDY